MKFEEVAAGMARPAETQANLPTMTGVLASYGNPVALAAMQEEYYAYAAACGFSRGPADDVLRWVQGLAAGSTPTARDFANARRALRADGGDT